MRDPRELYDEASRLATERRWPEAAAVFAQLGERSEEAGNPSGACWAWDAAGEAWRRDDQPWPASKALRRAMHLAEGRDQQALSRVKLAGVLGEVGELGRAESLCHEAVDLAEPLGLLDLAVDTLVGTLFAAGRVGEAAPWVDTLGRSTPVVRVFRTAQLRRYSGRLDEALEGLEQVERALTGQPAAIAGLAAARAERAEIAALRGMWETSGRLYREAMDDSGEAARPSLRLRAEAGGVRAMVEAGATPLVGGLDRGLALAEGRKMIALEIDLRIARGMALAAQDPARSRQDLDRAVAAADRCGYRPRAGRARLYRAVSLEDREAIADLQHALVDLAGSAPWIARAELALAERLAVAEPVAARDRAAAALAVLDRAGMTPYAGAARALLARL